MLATTADASQDVSLRKKPKLRPIVGKVVSATRETWDTWTLNIQVPEGDRDYIAGQFLNIAPQQFPELVNMVAYLEHVKGRREVVRAYSIASAPHEPYVAITTKPERFYPGETEYPPLLSPLLASDLLVGRNIEFTGYTGAYILPERPLEVADVVLHFVAGSGSVPNVAILKDELVLGRNPGLKHVLINVNKTRDDIIYRELIEKMAKDYAQQLKVVNFITREANPERYGPDYVAGRPTVETVSALVGDPSRLLVYACGAAISKWQRKKAELEGKEPTPRFLESVTEIVQALGVDKKRFKKEIYG
jgi:3-ketosteroid 9alpha-monooxygenase subunit B